MFRSMIVVSFMFLLTSCFQDGSQLVSINSNPNLVLSVETSPDGNGSSINSLNLWDVSSPVEIYGISRTKGSNIFVGNDEVSWVLEGSMGSLSVLEGGKMARFIPSTPGSGKIKVISQGMTQTISVSVATNSVPSINILEPAGDNDQIQSGDSFSISWTDSDPEDDAEISIYYSSANTGSCSSGIEIVNSISEDASGSTGDYSWDTTTVTPGLYYICAHISDGYNSSEVWSSGQLQIGSPPSFSFNHPTGNDDQILAGLDVSISFTASDSDDDANIKLFFVSSNSVDCGNTSSPIATLSEDTHSGYDYNTQGVNAGTYYICAEVDDGSHPILRVFSGEITVQPVCFWTGNSSNDFHSAANWEGCDGQAPTSNSSIVVPSTPANQPLVSSDVTIKSFASSSNGGGTITLASGAAFTLSSATDSIASSIGFKGETSTCTNCRVNFPDEGGVVNSATLSFGKGLFAWFSGNSSEFHIGDGSTAGHLRFEGGNLEAEKPLIDSNDTWGFSGFNITGTATEKSSVYVDGARMELYGANDQWAKGFEFHDHFEIKKFDNMSFYSNGDKGSRAEDIKIVNCSNAVFADTIWENNLFDPYKDNSNHRAANINISACSSIGPITMVSATGLGYGSYAEKDDNNVLNWQNETSYDCVWSGATSTDWFDSGNWSSCSNLRGGYPDQFDTARIPSGGNQPTLNVSHAVLKINAGSGGGTISFDNAHLFLLEKNFESDLNLTGVSDACTKCGVRGEYLRIVNDASLSLYRGVYLGTDTGNNIFVGSSGLGSGHLTISPASTDPNVWPKLTAFYYYFSGVIIEGESSAQRSSLNVNGVKFDRGYHTSHVHFHFKNHSQIDGMDKVMFDTANGWSMTGKHIYVEDCASTNIVDTTWNDLDFVEPVTGNNIYMNNCSSLATDSITVTKDSSGSNGGYVESFLYDPDNVINWVP